MPIRNSDNVILTGSVYKYDLSLPVSEIYGIVEATRERLKGVPDVEVVSYGHLGDGNIHLNVSVPELHSSVQRLLEPFVYEFCSKRKGSISAEHGKLQLFVHQDNRDANRQNEHALLFACRSWSNEE